MNIELHEMTIRGIAENGVDHNEEGVIQTFRNERLFYAQPHAEEMGFPKSTVRA